MEQSKGDLRKQVETLKDEKTKVKVQMIMNKNQMIREIDTLNKQIQEMREQQAATAAKSEEGQMRGVVRSSKGSEVSKDHRGEREVDFEDDGNERNS